MATSLLKSGALQPNQIIGADIDQTRRDAIAKAGIATTAVPSEAVKSAATILLAVKPQVLANVLASIADAISDQLIISIAAGVPIATYQNALGADKAIVRVMPNVLCTVGEAASAYCPNAACSAEQAEFVGSLLNSVGSAVHVDEKLMDAVTGLSGSGPAFVALFVEALTDGGVASGLPRAQAANLAIQTVLGSARWLQENNVSPAVLKDMVTSPAGTTIAGVRALEDGAMRSAVIDAVVSATERSRELGS